MKTLAEAQDLLTDDLAGADVIVRLRGGSGRYAHGVVRLVHEDTDEVTVEVEESMTYDFALDEVWRGSFAWVALRGRSPSRVFIDESELVLFSGDEAWIEFECFAIDPEDNLHPAVLRMRTESIDYVLTNGHLVNAPTPESLG